MPFVDDFNGKRLRMARIIRGLSSPQLASMVDISKQAVWQYENGKNKPANDTLFRICTILGFPYQFFHEGKNDTCILGESFCRTVTSTAKCTKEKEQICNIFRARLMEFFSQYISFPDQKYTGVSYNPHLGMEEFTNNIRTFYGLDNAPINNMVSFLENTGILVSTFHHVEDKFDGLSQAPMINGKKYKITVYNLENTTFARVQFTLAHELGHWLLNHIHSDEETLKPEDYKDNEKEANEFAACLLLPKEAFIQDLYDPTSLMVYVDLKKKWKVSVATMIMRAHNLGLINYSQYQSLYRQLSQKGWRTSEPFDSASLIPKPTLLSQAVDILSENNIISKSQLSDYLFKNCFAANQKFYEELMGFKPHTLDPISVPRPALRLKLDE